MEEDLIYIERNADPRDRRIVRPGSIVPARAVSVHQERPARVAYNPPPEAVIPASSFPAFAQQFPQSFVPQSFVQPFNQTSFFGPTPVYSPGPNVGRPWMGGLGGLFGGLNLGDMVQLAADAFAAFKSLPAAPVPTGDVATDVANTDVHLTALAKDAQTRKQIEFAGEVAGRFGRGFSGAW